MHSEEGTRKAGRKPEGSLASQPALRPAGQVCRPSRGGCLCVGTPDKGSSQLPAASQALQELPLDSFPPSGHSWGPDSAISPLGGGREAGSGPAAAQRAPLTLCSTCDLILSTPQTCSRTGPSRTHPKVRGCGLTCHPSLLRGLRGAAPVALEGGAAGVVGLEGVGSFRGVQLPWQLRFGVLTHSCNPTTWQAEAGRLLGV